MIAAARAAGQDAGTSQNTDSSANAGTAAGNATTATDAKNASNATAAPSPAAPADAAPVPADFQQALNQANATATQGDPNAQAEHDDQSPRMATAWRDGDRRKRRHGIASGRRDQNGRNQSADIRHRHGECRRHAPQTTTAAADRRDRAHRHRLRAFRSPSPRARRPGSSQFDIRLDPPELGRIEVQLNVDSNGQVISHITADRQDTLNLLQSQQPQLQQALEQAGLKTSDSAMQFSLRDQSFAGQQQQNQNFAQNGNNSQSNTQQIVIPDSSLSSVDTAQIYSRLNLRGGLDIRV